MGGTDSTEARRLVFGDDGSRGADIAWLWVNNHPWAGWRVDVLTGAEPPVPAANWGTPTPVEPWTPPWGRAYFDESSLASFSCAHAELDARLLLGEQTDADVVVVGHAGAGHLRAAWMGSTAEWLLHHPTAPLAIVRSAAQVHQVTYCSDGSVHARRALEAFLALPLAATAEVTVLAVDDERVDVDAAGAASARLDAAGVEHTLVGAQGRPSRVILEHLEAARPQLVVLGTRGLTGWHRLRLGSTAAAVVHHAPCTSLVACVDGDSTHG